MVLVGRIIQFFLIIGCILLAAAVVPVASVAFGTIGAGAIGGYVILVVIFGLAK